MTIALYEGPARASFAFNTCAVCRTNPKDNTWVRTEVDALEGEVVLCSTCCRRIARALGYEPPSKRTELIQQNTALRETIAVLTPKAEWFDNIQAAQAEVSNVG